MNFLRRYANQALFLQIGLLLGFFILKVPSLNFSSQVDPFEFANLIITLILAFLISQFIEPANESRRVEKNLMIEQLQYIKNATREIHDLFIDHYPRKNLTQEEKQKFITLFRSVSLQITLFFEQIDLSENYKPTNSDNLKNTFFRYKGAITGGRFDTSDFKFSSKPYNSYETTFMNFVREINFLIFDINKK